MQEPTITTVAVYSTAGGRTVEVIETTDHHDLDDETGEHSVCRGCRHEDFGRPTDGSYSIRQRAEAHAKACTAI